MTEWNATPADFQDAETLARAARVTFQDHFAIRFRHRLAGSWSDWLFIKTRDFFCQSVPPHGATERAWEAGLPDLHAAQLRQLAFLEAVERAGISLDAIEVEIIAFPAETVIKDWQRAAGR
jgi:hypothetical protein